MAFLFVTWQGVNPLNKRVGRMTMEIGSLFRQIAHLAEQVGEAGFLALISSENTGKVKRFVETLVGFVTMLIGDRAYESFSYLRGGEKVIDGTTMVARAKEMRADGSEEAGRYLLDNQKDIPVECQGKVVFVFPEWRPPGGSSVIACVGWGGGRWVQYWCWAGGGWGGGGRLLRRK
ncbi:MAG: hypothetical protein V1664_00515 [Candidatus Uhrbacteria bacterium]